jgi:ABC-type multidrug transport system ATPase subunit
MVAIGIELITNPSLLFLDEPTSGLDSFMALKVSKLLRNLAVNYNKTIVATVHQPSSEAFALFDRLILICDGNIVYQGLANDVVPYFKQRLGFTFSSFSNPADNFMRVMHVNYPKKEKDLMLIEHLARNYQINLASIVD